jgi:Flp pilus assembly protein TadD
MAVFIEPAAVWNDMARQELERSAALDPNLAETHVVRHMLLYSAFEGYRIKEAVNEIKLAQQIDPNIGHLELAHLYVHIGLEEEADAAFERALAVDPNSEHIKNNIAGDYRVLNQYDKWVEAQRKYFPDAKLEGWYYLGKGRLEEAERDLQEQMQKTPNGPGTRVRYGVLRALKGDHKGAIAEAQQALELSDPGLLSHHHVTYDVACIYAIAGDAKNAVKWLRVTADLGFPSYPMMQREQFFAKIRTDPEFVSFIADIEKRFIGFRSEFGSSGE